MKTNYEPLACCTSNLISSGGAQVTPTAPLPTITTPSTKTRSQGIWRSVPNPLLQLLEEVLDDYVSNSCAHSLLD